MKMNEVKGISTVSTYTLHPAKLKANVRKQAIEMLKAGCIRGNPQTSEIAAVIRHLRDALQQRNGCAIMTPMHTYSTGSTAKLVCTEMLYHKEMMVAVAPELDAFRKELEVRFRILATNPMAAAGKRVFVPDPNDVRPSALLTSGHYVRMRRGSFMPIASDDPRLLDFIRLMIERNVQYKRDMDWMSHVLRGNDPVALTINHAPRGK